MEDAITSSNQYKILVTGASGFIGGHLCRYLANQNHRVIGAYRTHPGDLPAGIIPAKIDLNDPALVHELIAREKPDVIYHLASCVTGSRDRQFVRPTFEANLASTVYLMEAAAGQSCRKFILTGSLEEPDHVQAAPSSPYAAAKAAATAYARMFHALYQFPAVIARVFMVYGPDQKDKKKLVPYVIDSLLDGQPPRMSSGTRLVDWIYVNDVVEGLVRLAEADGVDGKTVDIGTGILTSVREVVERIAHHLKAGAMLNFDPAADRPMEQVRAADADATEKLTGWKARHTLDEGLLATIRWHQTQRQYPDHA